MKRSPCLLFVADGRSPIASNWMKYFIDRGYRVHLISIYPCSVEYPLETQHIIPVAFSGVGDSWTDSETTTEGNNLGKGGMKSRIIKRVATPPIRTMLRHWFVPLSLPRAARQLRVLTEQLKPDLIHAMRIPYEGMLTALALEGLPVPKLVSVWGNDFTLHAPATPLMRRYTYLTLRSADALHTDCHRDLRLAEEWGFPPSRPAVVLPGAGGVQMEIFTSSIDDQERAGYPLIINPRGYRAYVRNDTFFKSIPYVLAKCPEAHFLCPAMAGNNEAEHWVSRLGISSNVDLLPRQARSQMAQLFRRAQVAVSITDHDGTPNTLLEAMACGCFPVVSNLESLREWVKDNLNGRLVEPGDYKALAQTILDVLDDQELRYRAQKFNLDLIRQKADYAIVMRQAEAFYSEISGISPPLTD